MRRGRDTREGVSGPQEGPEARNPPRFRWVLSTSSHAPGLFRSGRPLSHLTGWRSSNDLLSSSVAAFRGFEGVGRGSWRGLAGARRAQLRAQARPTNPWAGKLGLSDTDWGLAACPVSAPRTAGP